MSRCSPGSHIAIVALLLAVFCAVCVPTSQAVAWKSDPNVPDTLTIPSFDWRGDTLVTLPISTSTDDSLAIAQIVLTWDNPALKVISVNLTVGRWNVPGYHRWTKSGTSNGVVMAFIPTQRRLPPGSGVVAQIQFGRDSAYTFDQDFVIEPGTITPAPPLTEYASMFADLANDPFLPGLIQEGTVTYSPCFCEEHGKISGNNDITALDLNDMIDDLFFSSPLPPTDPDCPHIHRGDFNCDNTYDALDLNAIIDYLFFAGASPCDPCEDLP